MEPRCLTPSSDFRRTIIVHAVVVFVPLTGLAAVALTAVPRWRTRFGVLAALAALTSIVYVIRIGHAGSAAVWSDLPG